MNPAFSVIFLTTLIGVAQGLAVALVAADLLGPAGAAPGLQIVGNLVALGLAGLGLVASFFHLGHPERAWRSATQWRTSWLAREVIALPLFMAGLAALVATHWLWPRAALPVGVLVVLLCAALFVCTAMVYMSIRFLQEWASPLTMLNFTLLGCASGCMLASALAAWLAPGRVGAYALATAILTLAAFVSRVASLRRNATLRPVSSLQTAIGIKHPRIVQTAQGFMGGSFNTREFFHGRSPRWLRGVKWAFLLLVFPLPLACLAAGAAAESPTLLGAAFALQYLGLLAERWFFLAQARHPQNLYYQAIS